MQNSGNFRSLKALTIPVKERERESKNENIKHIFILFLHLSPLYHLRTLSLTNVFVCLIVRTIHSLYCIYIYIYLALIINISSFSALSFAHSRPNQPTNHFLPLTKITNQTLPLAQRSFVQQNSRKSL